MPIHGPKIFGFWGLEPLNVIGHHRDPQNAHPWPKLHLHANFGADGPLVRPGRVLKESKKRKKEERKKKARKKLFLVPFSH